MSFSNSKRLPQKKCYRMFKSSFSQLAAFAVGIHIVFGSTLLSANPAENQIDNPGFESGGDGWTLFLPKDENQTLSIVQEEPHSGANCARTFSPTVSRYALKVDGFKVAVTPGQRLKVSAWVRFGDDAVLAEPQPAAYIRLQLRNKDGHEIADPLLHFHICLDGTAARSPVMWGWKKNIKTLPQGWQHLEGVVEIPDGVTTLVPEFFVHGVSGSVFWDDLSLSEVDATEPLSEMVESE